MEQYQTNHPEKIIDTFNKIPYGGGHELLAKEFKDEINKLKRAGYGIVLVSHIKDKIFDKDSEQEHTKTVPDLSDKERNLISAMADFLLLGDFETEIIEPAVRDGNDKVIKEAVTDTRRVLYLRTNEKAESGFRWDDCPATIDFDFDEFKKVFQQAVSKEIERGKVKFGISDDKAKEIEESMEKIKQEKQAEVVKEEQEKDVKETNQEDLKNSIKAVQAKAKDLKAKGFDVNTIKEIIGKQKISQQLKSPMRS
jgi:hypothetical protein